MTLRELCLKADAHIEASALLTPDTIDADIADQFEAAFAAMEAKEKRRAGRPRKEKMCDEDAAQKYTIAALDFETDPFLYNRNPLPFCWDFYDGKIHTTYWNKFDESLCVPKLVEFIENLREPHLIYAHNGGKFDFLMFRKYLAEKGDRNMLVINGRIVAIKIGKHELRDSYAAIPVPEGKFKKDAKKKIDYRLFEANVRLQHYDEIIEYLKQDTETLRSYMVEYQYEFGNVKTMASAAIKELKKFYTYAKCNESTDDFFRSYYYGGRVQCFKAGVFQAPVKVYDVNSMYPFAMASYLHPIGNSCWVSPHITKDTFFLDVDGRNEDAFPLREKTGLTFASERGRYRVTIHEYNTALETGRFRPSRIHACYNCAEKCSFGEFVNHFYAARKAARTNNDDARVLFYKLVMNSAYGKFAQNPRMFENYQFLRYSDALPEDICTCKDIPCSCGGWRLKQANDEEEIMLIARRAEIKHSSFHNILTAASITGAARAILLNGIHNARNVYYCDTDSLICQQLLNVELDDEKLGAWKLEACGDKVAIAGKKLYAIWDHHKEVKKATKGSKISYAEIERVALGESVTWKNDAPSFKLAGQPEFITRLIRKTA